MRRVSPFVEAENTADEHKRERVDAVYSVYSVDAVDMADAVDAVDAVFWIFNALRSRRHFLAVTSVNPVNRVSDVNPGGEMSEKREKPEKEFKPDSRSADWLHCDYQGPIVDPRKFESPVALRSQIIAMVRQCGAWVPAQQIVRYSNNQYMRQRVHGSLFDREAN